jgi:hypothetical protein
VELNSKNGIVPSLKGRNDGLAGVAEGLGGGSNFPEVHHVLAVSVARFKQTLFVVEIEDSGPSCQLLPHVRIEVVINIGRLLEAEDIQSMLVAFDGLHDILIESRSQVGEKFKTQTGAPNGERIAFLVLIDGELQDEIGVLDPVIIDMDLILTGAACEQHSVHLLEQGFYFRLISEGVDGDNLRPAHLHELDVSSGDVGAEKFLGGRLIIFVDLGVDADDWILRDD